MSALWAAWGDAVGWISELTDEAGLHRRTKGQPLHGTVAWTRKIGGRSGINVDLPAGTYSDDTQLRLAVCRAYGPNGFDAEAFSVVELTVWPSYALGGGNGTKAAAASMTKPGTRWSANRPPGYVDAGGNGAAMRAQPHAWHAARPVEDMLRDVMRDAVTTHGHPRGILGAALSALAIADSMPGAKNELANSGPDAWPTLLDTAALIAEVPKHDPELHDFWQPQWLHPQLGEWPAAVHRTLKETREDAATAAAIVRTADNLEQGYRRVVEALRLRDPERRGSGSHTVIAALALTALASRHHEPVHRALLCAVQELDTDTDTIATMAGAVLGCSAQEAPAGALLDGKYIAAEATRVAAPAGPAPSRVRYPDLLTWEPPKTQADALLDLDGQLVVAGLGPADPLEPPMTTPRSEFGWQWVRVRQTSQTLVIKRRLHLRPASPVSLPARAPAPGKRPPIGSPDAPKAEGGPDQPAADSAKGSSGHRSGGRAADALQGALAKVRDSKYDVRVIGLQLARLARDEGPAVAGAFGGLVAGEIAGLGS